MFSHHQHSPKKCHEADNPLKGQLLERSSTGTNFISHVIFKQQPTCSLHKYSSCKNDLADRKYNAIPYIEAARAPLFWANLEPFFSGVYVFLS